MLLVCNGNLGSPLSCGKPNVGQTNKPIPANRCSAVLRQQVGLRPTAALNGRICCWRLQPSGVCRAATVVAETRHDQHSPRSAIQQQRVVFRTTHQVNYGEVIKVVGQGPQLGKWEVSGAPAMEWSDGDHWCLEVDLFPGMTDFKCAVVRQDGSVVCWEPGANRTVEVPHVNGGPAIHVKCTWSNTGNTIQALSMDEDDTADFTVDSMDEEEPHETTFMMHSSVHATSSAPNSDTDSPMVPGGGDKQMERGDRQGEYGDVDDEDMERANTGQMDKNRERVQQQGGGGKQATTSLPGKREKGQARDQAGVEDDNSQKQNLAPGQGVQLDEVESGNDELAENPASSRNPKPGTPKAFSNQQQGASNGTHSAGHLAAGLAGLAAVPIVAWSEYTLKTTGCGLPPGPGGLLGAAEGVAYLTVAALAVWSLASKLFTGRGLPQGPGGMLAGAEKLAFTTALAGIAVLGSQIKDYGYIPGALPDANCYGTSSSSLPSAYMASSPASNSQPVPTVFVSRITELSRSAFTGQAPDAASQSDMVATGTASSSSSLQASRPSRTDHTEPSSVPRSDPTEDGDPTPTNTRFSESAVQSTEAAKKSAGDLWTSLRATYNSVAETISELDFSPLGKQAIFVKDTLGAGFAGLSKSAAVLSQQLAQDVTKNRQGIPSELENRGEEVYSGAVDGLSSSDVNAVVEELGNEYNLVKKEVERDAETVRKAFQKAMHRAMGSVALLGTPSLQESFHQGMPASSSSLVKHASMTSQQPTHHRRVHQPLLGGVSVHSPIEEEPVFSLQLPGVMDVSGSSADANCAVSLPLRPPIPSPFSRAQSPSRQPLWGQQEVATRVLELSVRTMNVPLAQVSLDFPALDLHRLLVEANMMMMGAAATNAASAANNVNTTLGNAIQQLRVTVDTLKQTVNDVCTIAHRDRVDLNRLYKAVANLDNLLGGAKMTATSVELAPLAYQLDDAAASIRANESGVEADQLAGRLVKAAMSLRDTSSSISVTATLENAQRIVSKIPETAANEEDIAPLLQEFEDLTAQLQAELDKLSTVTTNISPSSL